MTIAADSIERFVYLDLINALNFCGFIPWMDERLKDKRRVRNEIFFVVFVETLDT